MPPLPIISFSDEDEPEVEPDREERPEVLSEEDDLLVLLPVLPLPDVEVEEADISLFFALPVAPLLEAEPVVPDVDPEPEDDIPEVELPEFFEPEPIDEDEDEELVVLPDPVEDDGLLPVFWLSFILVFLLLKLFKNLIW